MRVGQNPAKSIDHVAQPQRVTVAIVNYIPFLGGYYSESLAVLQRCLDSIQENTGMPYDLLVFDNASCPEVRAYLSQQRDEGRIQYLVLSDKNVGKAGAWNFIFGAAPGEFLAYADSDVLFYPGWLTAQLALFDLFPQLGMVTGAPLRIPEQFSTSTLKWAESEPKAQIVRGQLLSWEDWWKHARSLGVETEAEGRRLYDANQDVCIQWVGKRYFVGAAHFQFLAPRQALQSVLPIPSLRPMGQVRLLDVAMNQQGYLRLCTPEWWVQHLGNRLDTGHQSESARPGEKVTRQKTAWQKSAKSRILQAPLVRRSLLGLYDRIFRTYYQDK